MLFKLIQEKNNKRNIYKLSLCDKKLISKDKEYTHKNSQTTGQYHLWISM